MHIRKYILVLSFFLLCVIGCGEREGDGPGRQPNIILISLDTLRADHLHCYGYEREISPAIDGIAEAGVLFERVYAQSNWTLPSHVSMFSSLYPSIHGVIDKKNKIPANLILLPQILKKEGYRTASFNAGGFVSANFGFDRGFDVYQETPKSRGNMESICDLALKWITENQGEKFFMFLHTYEAHKPYAPPAAYEQKYIPLAGTAYETLKKILYKILDNEPLQFADYEMIMARRVKGELFDFVDKFYQENESEIRKRYSLSKGEFFSVLKKGGRACLEYIHDVYEYWHERRNEAMGYNYLLQYYDTEIIFVDDQIRRLLNLLRELELQENTMIILTSDHGEEFFDHRNTGHAINCYNEVIHTPLIFYYPGRLPAGVRIMENAALIDISPTILNMIGVQSLDAFQGISLLPAMKGERMPSRIIFSEHLISIRVPGYRPIAVIQDDWKYQCNIDILGIEGTELGELEKEPQNRTYADKIAPEELYQLRQDPTESKNVCEEETAVAEQLKHYAKAHLQKVYERQAETIAPDDELDRQLKELGYIE